MKQSQKLIAASIASVVPWGWQPTVFERRLNLSDEVNDVRFSIDIALFVVVADILFS